MSPVGDIGTYQSTSPAGEDGLDASAPVYKCYAREIGWRFCSECGCSPFASSGTYQVVEKEVELPGGGKETRKVWKLHPDTDKQNSYLSVNMHTIDANQPGEFDLREIHEKGMIEYLEYLNDGDPDKMGDHPYPGGMY
jgi:hypothetical protein